MNSSLATDYWIAVNSASTGQRRTDISNFFSILQKDWQDGLVLNYCQDTYSPDKVKKDITAFGQLRKLKIDAANSTISENQPFQMLFSELSNYLNLRKDIGQGWLPASLTTLVLHGFYLRAEDCPPLLEELRISYLPFTDHPFEIDKLPDTLRLFESDAEIEFASFTHLPPELEVLSAPTLRITSWKLLPGKLKVLNCGFERNDLYLPDFNDLPRTLEFFYCEGAPVENISLTNFSPLLRYFYFSVDCPNYHNHFIFSSQYKRRIIEDQLLYPPLISTDYRYDLHRKEFPTISQLCLSYMNWEDFDYSEDENSLS